MKRDSRLSAILQDKAAFRKTTAAKPFAEKLQILEQIRDRDVTIHGAMVSKRSGTVWSKKK